MNFYNLPIDVQKHINKFDPDFVTKKFVIYKTKIYHCKKDSSYNKFIKKKCLEKIKNYCKHTHIMAESDHDYHKPRYEYYCKYCLQNIDKQMLWKDKKIKREFTYY